VTAISADKTIGRAAKRRVIPLLASALLIGLIGAGSASAQGGTAPPTETTPAPPPTTTYPPGTALFPIESSVPHTFGQGFGVARKGHGHQGQDIFAACGSPLVAVGYTRVIFRGFHPSAGNYMVIRYKRYKQDYMYAHLAAPPLVAKKAKLVPGQLIGYVGETGNAQGCHLHFEIWSGKWYRGGHAVDPLPSLQAWDAYS
jgi:murein DD-endopeptidase MepM/ murein hydrolase activator NlpD